MMPPSGMVVLLGLNEDGELLFRKRSVWFSPTQPAHISLVNFECATDFYLFNFSPSSLTTEGLTILVWLGV